MEASLFGMRVQLFKQDNAAVYNDLKNVAKMLSTIRRTSQICQQDGLNVWQGTILYVYIPRRQFL